MKKFLVILFLLAYGFSASGMTLHLHYCCGKLKSIEWSPVADNECGDKHMMGSGPCCETKKITNSNDSDQENLLVINELVKFTKVPVLFADAASSPVRPVVSKPEPRSVSPPISAPPLFIQNCVFRI